MIGTGGAKLVLQSNSCAERITYEPGGRGFKSCRARQSLQRVAAMQPVFISGRVAES